MVSVPQLARAASHGHMAWRRGARHVTLPWLNLRKARPPFSRAIGAAVQAARPGAMTDLVKTWDSATAEAHVKYNISDHSCIWDEIARHCMPFAEGKDVADLGAGDGTLGKLLPQAGKMTNVDPFPPEDCAAKILKSDGVEFLRSQPDQSLDLVVATFAVHFMDRASLDKELGRVLKPTGRAIWFSFSQSSVLFGSEEFNSIYYSVGFSQDGSGTAGSSAPTTVLKIDRPATSANLRNHVAHRCHSNLKQMPEHMISKLLALIPEDLQALDIRLDVFMFAPNPSRDGVVQC
ncbi:unnamed protein product [Effrenium voratum]|uniref:Methyltransferase type 11 domain-containing protein n=1 Tax=Effrenium voratum TaxID=2562239 RepID=A0AA36HU10_9DINO|nr:unnamed protein product [Effrenium voratum]CAJ1418851.1 unnamed protein product [Effrenium voratum]CAJ1450259.1 unnamed protein product [Effrenium voratum]